MTISFMRKDENGNPVEVEIWRDEKTNNFIRIKRVTYLKNSGFITLRTDIYREDNEEEFKMYLKEELVFLNEYKKTLKKLCIPDNKFLEKELEKNTQISPKDELLDTINRAKKMKEDEEQR